MIKSYYILLLICISITNCDKILSKNLRKLEAQSVSFSKGENLRYEESKLKFDINLKSAPSLVDGEYKLTILYKGETVSSTCTYAASTASLKLSCEYSCNAPYYGSIGLPDKSKVLSDDTISLQLLTKQTIKPTQEISLTYKNAVMALNTDGNSYNIQIYLDDSTDQDDNTYFDLSLDIGTGYSVAGCTYSSSSSKMLDCNVIGSKGSKITFITDKKDGSIKWTNTEFPPESVIMKIVAETNVYGYDLDFLEEKWKFKIHLQNSDVTFNGYYCTINVILKKEDNTEVTKNALCERKYAKDLECQISGGEQAANDLVYISPDQAEATVSFKNDFLTQKKLMIRLIELKYEKAYELKFESSKWRFKIKVTPEGNAANVVRDGLNVTVALYRSSDNYHTASCTYISSGNLLSCERDKSSQSDTDALVLVPQKSVGSVTWSNLKDKTDNIKIPLEIKLTHTKSYYLAYEELKWTFKMKAKCTENSIPTDSKIIIDIIDGVGQYTTAECDGNASAQKGYETIFTCICGTLGSEASLKISNEKKEGSVTWDGLNDPISIDKRKEFKFIEANNMYLNYVSTADHKWYFDIKFEDFKNINPSTSDTYSIDILYTESETSSRKHGTAQCSLKSETSDIFSCFCNIFTTNTVKDVTIYVSKSTSTGLEFIQWTGIEDYHPIAFNTEFYFVKGTLSFNSKWYLNIKVENPKDGILPINSKVIIDITKDSSDETIDCIVTSNLLLKCETEIESNSLSSLPLFSVKKGKSDEASGKFLNSQEDDVFYYLYLETQLTFSSVQNLVFNGNSKWQFDLSITETLKDNTRFIIDVLYNNQASTATCTKGSDKISCTVDENSQSATHLVKISHTKSALSTITWKSLSSDESIILSKDNISVESIKQLSYENGKWTFKMNIENSDLPLESVVKIDISYKDTPNTATCTQKTLKILTCIPDVASQAETDTFTISSTKSQGSISYIAGQDTNKLKVQESKTLVFDRAYGLTLNGNNWEFQIHLTSTNLKEGESINIDILFNDAKTTSACVIDLVNLLLKCSKPKTKTDDKLILIKNEENQDLVWQNLQGDIVLYIIYDIKYINSYGGFYENKWRFNMKYERGSDNTIDANNNYALLDISVDNQLTTAECKITEKYLLCEALNGQQNKEQILKIYGTKTSGTVSITGLPDAIGSIEPISINLQQASVSDFDNSNQVISFKIKGKLKDNQETEIAENTITKIYIKVTKKTETNDNLDTICLTNEIKNSNDDVILSCKIGEDMNKDEDNVDIKVASDGKSNYVTFDSTTENIKVFQHEEKVEESQGQDNKPEEQITTVPTQAKETNNKKNNSFMTKINYIFLISIILLF